MFQLYRVPWLLAAVLLVLSCTASYREGLPPGSPFASPSAATSKALPQGITIADVTSQSALLWLRTEGSLRIQVEWAPVAAWGSASKTSTAVAPVARTALFTTDLETDFTLTIPFKGLAPATAYRYNILMGPKEDEGLLTEAQVTARGEFT